MGGGGGGEKPLPITKVVIIAEARRAQRASALIKYTESQNSRCAMIAMPLHSASVQATGGKGGGGGAGGEGGGGGAGEGGGEGGGDRPLRRTR